MDNRSRREFIKSMLAVEAALYALGGKAFAQRAPGQETAARGEKQVAPGMERRQFGKTDMKVSALGFGTAEIGWRRTDQATVDKLLNLALDTGLNVIDTAASYWGAEESIGKAVAHRRDEYLVFTKAGHVVNDEIAWYKGWLDEDITRGIDRSLRRLKTDRVDMVHLHSCDLATLERGEAIEALEKARKAGKTRYIGYSGDNAAALWAVESGHFDSLMTSINIADQQAIELTLPIARKKQMGVLTKRTLANAAWIHRSAKDAPAPEIKTYWERLQKLEYEFLSWWAKRVRGSNPFEIALRFPISLPGVHTAVFGSANPDHIRQNAEFVKAGPLPKNMLDAIRARWKAVAGEDWVGVV